MTEIGTVTVTPKAETTILVVPFAKPLILDKPSEIWCTIATSGSGSVTTVNIVLLVAPSITSEPVIVIWPRV